MATKIDATNIIPGSVVKCPQCDTECFVDARGYLFDPGPMLHLHDPDDAGMPLRRS